jgi:hypothetical protein
VREKKIEKRFLREKYDGIENNKKLKAQWSVPVPGLGYTFWLIMDDKLQHIIKQMLSFPF